MKRTGRGGPGRGQGRKSEYSRAMRRMQVTLDAATIAAANAAGGGNLSKGLRLAVAALVKQQGQAVALALRRHARKTSEESRAAVTESDPQG